MNTRNTILVVLLVAGCLMAGLAPAGRTVEAKAEAKSDPAKAAVGTYVGVFDPVGVTGKDGKVKPRPDCGKCHATATVKLDGEKHLLALRVPRGRRAYAFDLTGKVVGGKLVFKNANYTLTFADGKIVGKRSGKIVAEIRLAKAPKPADKPKPKD